MIVVFLCCMMKLVEFSVGKPVNNVQKRRRRFVRRRAKGMNEVGLKGSSLSPDSDCNSNHPNSSSYLSVSSQDVDFIQDNSDYQWFLDYGYREGGTNHHTSILSLPESYEAGDIHYYETLAKNMDANLAEADMDTFRTEDIHALLTNLPPMCQDHLSHEGECYASVSGSIMAKFAFDSSSSPHSSSQDSTSMSICKSELLFSPVKEVPVPGGNFSVDSLDCDFHDMMLTCQANKDNYTIAFEGSCAMYSEESDFHTTDKSSDTNSGSAHWTSNGLKKRMEAKKVLPMTRSDSGGFTTWSKLNKSSSDAGHARPSGNNNGSGDDATNLGLNDNSLKSQSMPNLYKKKLRNMVTNNLSQSKSNTSSEACTVRRKPVKVFDIKHFSSSGSGRSVSDMATSIDTSSSENMTNKHPNFNLVKLFMKQKSVSTEGMSTTADQLSSTENWLATQLDESNHPNVKTEPNITEEKTSNTEHSIKPYDFIAEEPEEEKDDECSKKMNYNLNNNCSYDPKRQRKLTKDISINRSIQTSHFSEILNLKNATKTKEPPIKVIEPSFLSKLKQEGEVQKPVYVLYPNYVLPNLDFLNEKQPDFTKVLLIPQRATSTAPKKRPFSCNDLETLKRRGVGHIKDWDSLNFLLPQDCKEILQDIPEIKDYLKKNEKLTRTNNRTRRRPMSCDYTAIAEKTYINQTNVSSSSSTATQPSSGYRGSSSILNDPENSPIPTGNLNPLFVYRYDSVTSSEASLMQSERQRSITTTSQALPKRCISINHETVPVRPPLPKTISESKRHSMYETNDIYYMRNKRLSETEDEGVDAGTSSSSLDEHEATTKIPTHFFPNMSVDELLQFEEYLKLSGISSSDPDDLNEESLTQLRSYVSKFLTLKMNQDGGEHFGGKKTVTFAEKVNVLPKNLDVKLFDAPHNSPNVSSFAQNKNYQSYTGGKILNEIDPAFISKMIPLQKPSFNIVQKWSLVNAVTSAVDQLTKHFSSATNDAELIALGDSNLNPACAKIALNSLCPALYAILSDGLKPNLETSFGAITNSVWQVVEASAKQGPLTKALNELVMRVNNEDAITEGLVKFNTFIFGLLNVRSLDAWACYLKTRESIIKKHYDSDSFLMLTHTGGSNIRALMDKLITALQPLAVYPFQLDLFYEYRQLHMSFKRMDSYQQAMSPTHKLTFSSPKQWNSPGLSVHSNRSNSDSEEISAATTVRPSSAYQEEENLPDILNSSTNRKKRSEKERPRSCCEAGFLTKPNFKLGEDVTTIAKKRWSGIALNSKLYQVYDRLAKEDDEEYTDSLENNVKVSDDNSDENVPNIEPESLELNIDETKPLIGRRFRKLQQKWEMLSGRDQNFSPPSSASHTPNTPSKSRIPRLITSPIKPSGIPVPLSSKNGVKKVTTPPENKSTPLKVNNGRNIQAKKIPSSRTSRVDQVEGADNQNKKTPRPSSLPYKAGPQNSKLSKIPPRRAVSSSLNRKPLSVTSKTPKVVKTLSHRLPSESGHLSYNEGENLKVILKVDDKWLLCCRGTQKGLVPISAVISADAGHF